jgi:hypothetical protein
VRESVGRGRIQKSGYRKEQTGDAVPHSGQQGA